MKQGVASELVPGRGVANAGVSVHGFTLFRRHTLGNSPRFPDRNLSEKVTTDGKLKKSTRK